MCVIKKSAEHALLARLEELKGGTQGWSCAYFAATKNGFNPGAADAIVQAMKANEGMRTQDKLAEAIDNATGDLHQKDIYLFPDGDVIFLGFVDTNVKYENVKKALSPLSKDESLSYFGYGLLQNEFQVYQKRAKEKMLSAKMFDAYEKMADKGRTSSITARRRMRDEPLVLMIEDDRFSGSYAANILIKDYDFVLCKTGEEGIAAYIEHAPDVAFIDVHLPGITGHETLEAIRSVDSEAFLIMLSADAVRDNIVQASQRGAKSFLKKPFSKERLLTAVKNSPYIYGAENVKGEIIV